MNHFYQNIPGFCTPCIRDLYAEMVQRAAYDAIFVELGSFLGTSAAFMAVEIINSGKDIDFHCVDTWEGSPEISEFFRDNDVWGMFQANVEPVRERLTLHRMLSWEAATRFRDESVDFCFIDADHAYDSVIADIKAWLPKMKPGGVLAGHDYDDSFLGVVNAVNDTLQGFTVQGKCWLYEVPLFVEA